MNVCSLCICHRYLRKVDCSSFVMCPLLVLPLPRAFLQRLLTILTRRMRQALCVTNQSIFLNDVFGIYYDNYAEIILFVVVFPRNEGKSNPRLFECNDQCSRLFFEVGHLSVCKESKRVWVPNKFYSHLVLSQLY